MLKIKINILKFPQFFFIFLWFSLYKVSQLYLNIYISCKTLSFLFFFFLDVVIFYEFLRNKKKIHSFFSIYVFFLCHNYYRERFYLFRMESCFNERLRPFWGVSSSFVMELWIEIDPCRDYSLIWNMKGSWDKA